MRVFVAVDLPEHTNEPTRIGWWLTKTPTHPLGITQENINSYFPAD